MNKGILKQLKHAAYLIDSNRHKQAEEICLKMLRNKISHPGIHFLMGLCLVFWHRFEEASEKFQQVLKQQPEHSSARISLMLCYKEMGQIEKSIALCQPFLDHPQSPEETYHTFILLQNACEWYQARKLLNRVVLDLKQGNIPAELMSNTIIHLNELAEINPVDLFQIHCQWGKQIEEKYRSSNIILPQPASPNNKIKIGYLSIDFNKHPVGFFSLPVIQEHDRTRFEVFCYGRVIKDDEVTSAFRQAADHFIDITALSPAQAAMRIAEDCIHILIDLSGHTARSPIEILAFKPAPVQISYLGYPNTTGLKTVDFRITDQHCDAENGGTRYVEKLLHLPNTFLCMRSLPEIPRAEKTPAESNGFITFGSFNNIRKLNPQVIQTWAGIMQKIPNSKIFIKSKGCEQSIISNHIVQEFKRHGIDSKRIAFDAYSNLYNDHIALFNQVDIVLDTFPYHGTRTTCDALWMGLPVITLEGKAHVQRVSASILKCIGFESTIAHSTDEYIEIAADMASRPENLTLLRNCIHMLFKNSLILNPKKVTRQLEEQYLKAWEIKMGSPALAKNPMTHEEMELTALKMHEDITIMLPQNLNQICTYILTEQGDWYEDEIRFLRRVCKQGMRVLDLSAGYGCYSLSMAKQVGSTGAVLALAKDAIKRNAIEKSASQNGFDWLATGTDHDTSSFLHDGVDMMIHPLSGIDSTASYLDIPVTSSPLVMIHAMQENGIHESLTQRMQEQGYSPYRLIPALNLLVPVQAEFTPVSWHQQVFFCNEDRAGELAHDGFLLLHEQESIDLPDDLSYWQQAIEGRAFANALLPLWIEQVQDEQTSDDWEQVRNALSAYAMAHNDSSAQQRYAYLSASLNLLLNTEGLQSSAARLCTVARIASELGNYDVAQQVCKMVTEGITTCQIFSPDEPFLPISSIYDHDNYQDNLAEWILAQSIAQIEFLKNPTSFWVDGSELLKTVDILQDLDFMDDDLCRRELLVRKRMHANNNQALMVFDRLSPDMWRMLRTYAAETGKGKNQNLVLAIPNGEDRDKINLYLKNMCSFEAATGLAVQIIISNADGSQKQFLHNLLQQSGLVHAPKTSSTTLQNMAVEMAKEMGLDVVWHDETPDFMPNPLPPVKDFRVTIMLTTYNRVDLLKRAVESILKQSYDDYILVIHDDASTDGTEEYCTKLSQNNTIVRYRRNKKNLGPGKNGADMTEVDTELVMGFTDDDFMWDSTALEKMVNAFRQHPHIGMAFGQCLIGDVHTEKPNTSIPYNCTTDCILDPHQMLLDSIAGNQIYGAGHILRKSMGEKLIEEYITNLWGKSDIGIEGDYVVGLVECMVAPIAYVHIPSVYYSLWPQTISSSQLGGGWSMHIRLRAVAFLDDMYNNHFGRTRSENKRIQLMADIFKKQLEEIQKSMTNEELIEHKDELDCYVELIACIRNHELPDSLYGTNLLQ